ncbi:hypothetical protein JCM5353_006957 [Sporobolomyces roseus]
MVGQINMKQLRRQEERAKKKAATREMEQQQCEEYFEQGAKGDSGASTKGINRKGKAKEEQKEQDRKEDGVKLEPISWHGEVETNRISFPDDLRTAYKTLKIEVSATDEVVIEYSMEKLENVSFAISPDDLESSARELGCILLVLCDRTVLFDSDLFILIQFIYAAVANKYLERLRLPIPRIVKFTAPSVIPNFPIFSGEVREIRRKLYSILLDRLYPSSYEQYDETDQGTKESDAGDESEEEGSTIEIPAEVRRQVMEQLAEQEQLQDENLKLKQEIEELKRDKKKLKSEKDRLAKTNVVLSSLVDRRKEEEGQPSKVANFETQLEQFKKESSRKDAEIKSLKEREERTNTESKKMRERASKQLAEKHEEIRELKEIANTKTTLALARVEEQSKDISTVSSDLSKLREQLEEAHEEITVKTAEVATLRERKERAEVESKTMRERSREQLREKDEMIKEMRESNAKLTRDVSTATAQTALDDDKLKTELADVKVQLREAQATSTSFSEFKDCISLQSKVSKELAVEVARLKASSSFSTSSPSSSDKKDFVISTLSKKVIDLSKQVKEQNEQLAEMMIVMSKPDDD